MTTVGMGNRPGPSFRTIARIFFSVLGLAVLCYLLYRVRATVGLVLIGVFLAIAMGPAVDLFQRARLPRGLAILAVFICLFLVVFLVGLLLVPPVVEQVEELANDIPQYLQELRQNDTIREYDDKYDITQKLREQAESLPSRLGDAAGALQAVTVGVFSALVQLVTVLTVTFFLLLDGTRISTFLLDQTGAARERYARVAHDVYRSVGGYVSGVLSLATLSGICSFVVLTILGVPAAVPLAVLMAFTGLIPMVGATIGGAGVAIVTLFNDFPTDTVVWVVYLIAYQQLENNVLQPQIYKRTVNLHPLVVIVAILVGAGLLGVLGALVAIPIAAAIQILVKDWWKHRRRQELEPVSSETPVGGGATAVVTIEPQPDPG